MGTSEGRAGRTEVGCLLAWKALGQGRPTSESQLPVTSCDVCQGILCPALDFRDTFPWKEPLFISVISVLTTHTTLTMDSYSPTIGFIELVVFFFPRVIF